jgi:hypothetical protein
VGARIVGHADCASCPATTRAVETPALLLSRLGDPRHAPYGWAYLFKQEQCMTNHQQPKQDPRETGQGQQANEQPNRSPQQQPGNPGRDPSRPGGTPGTKPDPYKHPGDEPDIQPDVIAGRKQQGGAGGQDRK